MIYLDHNATTPMLPSAVEVMMPFFRERFGNASSAHEAGQEAAAALDTARRRVAGLLGAASEDVVFTATGTESVHTALVGAARFRAEEGRHVVVSAIEHSAGLDAARRLAADGFSVSSIPPLPGGRMDPGRVLDAVRPDTVLVSVMHANNETGVLQPVGAIGAACRERGVWLHTDAIQSAGKVPLDVNALHCDMLSLAGHKFGGPKGAAALWLRRGVRIDPLIPGRQEGGRRGGTPDTAAVAGLGAAALWAAESLPATAAGTAAIRDRFEAAVLASVPGARVTGADVPRLPNTAHFTFGEEVGGDLVMALDLAGYAVSSGSACTSGSEEPSHVLLAMGFSPAAAASAVRVSVGPDTPEEAASGFARALAEAVRTRRGPETAARSSA